MNETKKKPYNLLHITSKANSKKILKDGFISSKHNLENSKNQWLGDGVYFWDGNDDEIASFGKNMLKNKYNKNDMVEIYGNIEIQEDRHLNLEIEKNMKSFCEFVRKVNPNTAEQTLDLLKSLRGELKVNPKQLYQIGKFLGTYINLYIKTLKDQGYDIDMVSCYFYHGTSKFSFLGRSEKTRRQFCIKNMTLLNSNIRNFKIYNNF